MKSIIVISAIIIVTLVMYLVLLLNHNQKLKKIINFLDNVEKNSVSIKSPQLLASLGIESLNRYGHKLLPFYQTIFSMATIMHLPDMVNKIGQYIKSLNELENSEERHYLITIFRQAIVTCKINSLAFIIYYSVKIKHRDNNKDGERVETFLIDSQNNKWPYRGDLPAIIDDINFYEKCEPVLNSSCRKEIRKNLDQIIKIIKY